MDRGKSKIGVHKSEANEFLDILSNFNQQRPSPKDFEQFLLWACKQYCVDVTINAHYIPLPSSTKTDRGRSRINKLHRLASKKSRIDESDKTVVLGFRDPDESKFTKVLTTYDPQLNVVGLNMNNTAHTIPQKLFKIIAIIIQFYPLLTRLTFSKGINSLSIREISKLLTLSNITEVILDGTFLKNPNYHMLLESSCKINCLSLSRCEICDEVLKKILENLVYGQPCERTLIYLNLSSNKITDEGAGILAATLRSNRQLAYINLSGNSITNKGAISILDTLLAFCLHEEEDMICRLKYIEYLKKKEELISKYLAQNKPILKKKDLVTASLVFKKPVKKDKEEPIDVKQPTVDKIHKVKTKTPEVKHHNSTLNLKEDLRVKAETVAIQTIGTFDGPFVNIKTYKENGIKYCIGNNTLTCLNVGYNNLSYEFLKKLVRVLNYQNLMQQKPRGLFRVRFEGNNLPKFCDEYDEINKLLESSLVFQQGGETKRGAEASKSKRRL